MLFAGRGVGLKPHERFGSLAAANVLLLAIAGPVLVRVPDALLRLVGVQPGRAGTAADAHATA